MEFGSKLEEMNLTSDEMSRLSKAMRDDNFRRLLHEYAEEISNPENKKIYEEEIKQLEQERGMNVQFIHPKPFRALKTSDGQQKCFINICSSELIAAAECKSASSEDGRKGVNWSLPYSLTPGHLDADTKGRKHMIYDVVFHPDTLHIASKSGRFMELVDSTALDGVQNAFHVNLDRKNKKVLKTKYKGTPHASVIRKPVPGHSKLKPTEPNDPIAFPYPYDRPQPSTKDNKNAKSGNGSLPLKDTRPVKVQSRPSEKAPTVPHYTIKYRSVVDLQDYRCSRDSAPGPRPKEIIIHIDLPLLKAAKDADLDIRERQLVLKSSKPAYLLELDLAYPVDVNKGHAKFNKQKNQLVVTLSVLPLEPPALTTSCPALVSACDDQYDSVAEESTATGESSMLNEPCASGGSEHSDSDVGFAAIDTNSQSKLIEVVANPNSKDICADTNLRSANNDAEIASTTTEESPSPEPEVFHKKVSTSSGTPVTSFSDKTLAKIHDIERSGEQQNANSLQSIKDERSVEPDSICDADQTTSSEPHVGEHISHLSNDDNIPLNKVHSSNEGKPELDSCESDSCHDGNDSVTHVQAKKAVHFCDKVSVVGGDSADEDDLPEEQYSREGTARPKQPPVVLLEKNPEDGTEVVISDHTTSAAFTFQNSYLYELD